jgi:hypothetical protein
MPAVLPPGLSLARRGQPLARALTTAVLAIPLVLVTVAFIPAFVICPFLGTSRQDMVDRVLARLQEWTAVLAGPRHPCPCQESQGEDRQ